jgi:hypothetical protein
MFLLSFFHFPLYLVQIEQFAFHGKTGQNKVLTISQGSNIGNLYTRPPKIQRGGQKGGKIVKTKTTKQAMTIKMVLLRVVHLTYNNLTLSERMAFISLRIE